MRSIHVGTRLSRLVLDNVRTHRRVDSVQNAIRLRCHGAPTPAALWVATLREASLTQCRDPTDSAQALRGPR